MKILQIKIRVLAAWNNHGGWRSQAELLALLGTPSSRKHHWLALGHRQDQLTHAPCQRDLHLELQSNPALRIPA